MSRGAMAARLGVLLLAATCSVIEARGQDRSVDLSVGRIAFDRLPSQLDSTALVGRPSNLVVSVRHTPRRGPWLYGSASTPFSDDALLWGAVGSGGRFLLPGSEQRRASAGLDVATHGYAFRDALAETTGTGGVLESFAVGTMAAGAARLEVRGGWRGQALSFAGGAHRRDVLEAGGRLTLEGALRVQVEARWVRADENVYPFAGTSILYNHAPYSLWAQAGKWFGGDEFNDVVWTGGAGYALGSRSSLWLSVRQEASDPLYRNAARRTWSVGLTRRFGQTRLVAPRPQTESGAVILRVTMADAPTSQLSVAGSFNDWQLQPMHREDQTWVLRLRLEPGVYDYAFRSAEGTWFVPASVPGRRDDGMGGHVALLVVP